MNRWREYNANPLSKRVGDCTIRALSKALNKDWETVYAELSSVGFELCDMPSANHVWIEYLKRNGFRKGLIPDDYPADYSVDDFAKDNPKGTFVLPVDNHVVTVVDGYYYDSWDSGNEKPLYYLSRGGR